MEIAVPIDSDPWERLLEVEVSIDHASATRNYPGHTETEVTSVEWSEHDPIDEDERMDAVLFYEENEDYVQEAAREQAEQDERDLRHDPPPRF